MRLVMSHVRYFFLLYFPGLDIPQSKSFLLRAFDLVSRPAGRLILFPKKDRLVNRFLKIKAT